MNWVTQAIEDASMDLMMGAPAAPIVHYIMSAANDENTDPYDRQRLLSALRWETREQTEPCPRGKHGEQEVVEFGSGTGFAGGAIYWTTYACGCVDMDESNDIRAAY